MSLCWVDAGASQLGAVPSQEPVDAGLVGAEEGDDEEVDQVHVSGEGAESGIGLPEVAFDGPWRLQPVLQVPEVGLGEASFLAWRHGQAVGVQQGIEGADAHGGGVAFAERGEVEPHLDDLFQELAGSALAVSYEVAALQDVQQRLLVEADQVVDVR